ncbi:linear amide C-N hydrolase [Aeoliella mucimassa]|uniref:Penicillin acylase n=1 Tax=Aeoliella mucimassa TaxID=2527972 RepID=A0A518AJC4_9BACT|nr:linear amide C-N hydrolase [Aeoliella mucimassa]QDU54841.1 Penicillin acylase precursor [Aeoliella mucimassa]
MCSRVKWTAEGQPVLVGRNMDWTARMGSKLYAMPKGVAREGLVDVNPLQWTSKYGSVVTIVWDCATSDGINEAGLCANLLYLAESNFGQRVTDLPGVSISLWVQYLLDTCATVAEAVAASQACQVQSFELVHQGTKVDAPLHLSLADASGDSAVVEILSGNMVVHHGPQYSVMTNSPIYDEQLVLLKQYEGLGGKKPIPGTMEAEDRFARGAFYLTKLPEDPGSYQAAVAGVLSVIRNMATPLGANDPERPNIAATIWRTFGDCTNKRYYFEFCDMPNVVWVDLDQLNLDADADTQLFDLAADLDAAGEVSAKFEPADPIVFQPAGTAVRCDGHGEVIGGESPLRGLSEATAR